MHPADVHVTCMFGTFSCVQRCEIKGSEAQCDRLGLRDAPPGKSSLGLTRHMAEMKPLLSASARIAVYAGCPCDRTTRAAVNQRRRPSTEELSCRAKNAADRRRSVTSGRQMHHQI